MNRICRFLRIVNIILQFLSPSSQIFRIYDSLQQLFPPSTFHYLSPSRPRDKGTEGNVAKYFNCTRSIDRVRCLFLVSRYFVAARYS